MSVSLRVLVPAVVWLVVTTPIVLSSGLVAGDRTPTMNAAQQSDDNGTASGTPTLRAAQEPAANRSESALSRPPNVTSWNDRYVEDYTTGGVNFSARPSSVAGKSCCPNWSSGSEPLFNNTYVEIFSVTPSTIVHSRADTQRYVSPNGTVRAVANYRVPPRLVNATPGVTTDLKFTSVANETQLLVNGTVVDTASSTTPELQYQGLSGTAELTVRMTLRATVEDADNNTQSYSMRVTDSETVRVQNLSGLAVSGQFGWINQSETTRNDSVLTLSVPGRWHRIEYDNGLGTHSQWYYYTRVGDGWADWETTSPPSAGLASDWRPIAPLEVHAVPVTAGPELTYRWINASPGDSNRTDDALVELDYPESAMAPQPSLPPEIELDRANNSTTADRFTLRSSGSLRKASEFTVYGLVRGRSVNYSVDTTDPALAHDVNLTAEVLTMRDEGTRIRVSALSNAGQPIEHGRLIVEGRRDRVARALTPADDGTVVVELNQSAVWKGTLRYEPAAPWWQQSRPSPVVATEVAFVHTTGLAPIDEIIDFIVITGLVFLPLYLLLYGFDVITNGKFLNWYEP